MTHYDYKVVPAPKRSKRIKGVRSSEELFALTLTDAINEVARQGWEYVRAEHLPAEASRGWFRSAVAADQTVLVFRRAREALGPRLAAVRPEPETAEPPQPDPTLTPTAERAVVDRLQTTLRRREPSMRLEPPASEPDAGPTPLRPSLGPAEKP